MPPLKGGESCRADGEYSMKRIAAVGAITTFVVAAVIPTPSEAYTCDDVRRAVATYGVARSAAWARVNLTPSQISAAYQCLKVRWARRASR